MCSAHIAAPGKAILAYLPAEERLCIVNKIEFKRVTDNTITDPEAFTSELDTVLTKGYALDQGEGNDGVNCVAVPVFDRAGGVIAGLWVSSFSNRLNRDNSESHAGQLQQSAGALTKLLDRGLGNDQIAKKVVAMTHGSVSTNSPDSKNHILKLQLSYIQNCNLRIY